MPFPERRGSRWLISSFYYNASSSFPLPIGGQVSASLDASIFTDALVAIDRTSLELLGGSYGYGAVLPVLWTELSGGIAAATGTRSAGESNSGIGDILFYPLMLGWKSMGAI